MLKMQDYIKFLNSITPSGVPPHSLRIKVGAVVTLLRNINLKAGLCNGVCYDYSKNDAKC